MLSRFIKSKDGVLVSKVFVNKQEDPFEILTARKSSTGTTASVIVTDGTIPSEDTVGDVVKGFLDDGLDYSDMSLPYHSSYSGIEQSESRNNFQLRYRINDYFIRLIERATLVDSGDCYRVETTLNADDGDYYTSVVDVVFRDGIVSMSVVFVNNGKECEYECSLNKLVVRVGAIASQMLTGVVAPEIVNEIVGVEKTISNMKGLKLVDLDDCSIALHEDREGLSVYGCYSGFPGKYNRYSSIPLSGLKYNESESDELRLEDCEGFIRGGLYKVVEELIGTSGTSYIRLGGDGVMHIKDDIRSKLYYINGDDGSEEFIISYPITHINNECFRAMVVNVIKTRLGLRIASAVSLARRLMLNSGVWG